MRTLEAQFLAKAFDEDDTRNRREHLRSERSGETYDVPLAEYANE